MIKDYYLFILRYCPLNSNWINPGYTLKTRKIAITIIYHQTLAAAMDSHCRTQGYAHIVSTNLKLYFILSECGFSVIFPASFKSTMQYTPELFRQIKLRIDRQRQLTDQYLMTGSEKFLLMEVVSESLAGRIAIINLHSLSVHELTRHFNASPNVNQILEWIVKGGYPEIYEHNLDHSQYFGD